MHFSNLHEQELKDLLDTRMVSGHKTQVCFVPTNSILAARKNKHVMDVFNSADIVMCDGVPVKWAAGFLGTPLKERLTGFDFFPHYVRYCVEKKYSVYFLGAKDGVAHQLADKYQLLYPSIRIAGFSTPPFAAVFSKEQNDAICADINTTNPDVLFVSLTAPKQDIWIHAHLNKINVKLALGVGAAFDSEAGSLKRAPILMQQMGLEWLYRFIQEPRRMFRRYFIDAPLFIPLIFWQKIRSVNK